MVWTGLIEAFYALYRKYNDVFLLFCKSLWLTQSYTALSKTSITSLRNLQELHCPSLNFPLKPPLETSSAYKVPNFCEQRGFTHPSSFSTVLDDWWIFNGSESWTRMDDSVSKHNDIWACVGLRKAPLSPLANHHSPCKKYFKLGVPLVFTATQTLSLSVQPTWFSW